MPRSRPSSSEASSAASAPPNRPPSRTSGRPSSGARPACSSTPGRPRSTPRCTASTCGPATRSSRPRSPSPGRGSRSSSSSAIPVFVDIDPRTYNLDAAPDRGEDRPADAGDHRRPHQRPAVRHGRDPRHRRSARPARHRGRLPGARRDLPRPPGRIDGRRRLLQPQLEQDPDRWRRRPVRRRRPGHHPARPAPADVRRGHPRAGAS